MFCFKCIFTRHSKYLELELTTHSLYRRLAMAHARKKKNNKNKNKSHLFGYIPFKLDQEQVVGDASSANKWHRKVYYIIK